MATSMNIPVQTLRSLRGVFFVEMSSSGDGQDEGGRGSTAGAGEGLQGDKIK